MNEIVKNLGEVLFRRFLFADTVIQRYELGNILADRAELYGDFGKNLEAKLYGFLSGKLFEGVFFAL